MPTSQTWNSPPPPPSLEDEGDWGEGGRPGKQRRAALTGTYVLLAAVTMLFAAFSSALVVRRGLGDDWESIPVPAILWTSTVLILVSSAALELAKRSLYAGERSRFNLFWSAGTLLGLGFLGCQYSAWRQLQAAGAYVSTTPGNSFFYLFTIAHAIHVLGGIGALCYIEFQALALKLGPGKRTGVDAARLYWHFLAGLWLYLILLFKFWG